MPERDRVALVTGGSSGIGAAVVRPASAPATISALSPGTSAPADSAATNAKSTV